MQSDAEAREQEADVKAADTNRAAHDKVFAEEPAAARAATSELKIFISYRREEFQGSVDYLYSLLEGDFGADNIFYDIAIDSIPPGSDFAECQDAQVSQCDVLLAVIGKRWLEVKTHEGELRLHEEDNFVRIEIASALERGITVIPVLFEGAEMPSKEKLPSKLQKLTRRQAAQVRPGPDFRRDVDRLKKALEGIEPWRD